jgi:hypothetical protein
MDEARPELVKVWFDFTLEAKDRITVVESKEGCLDRMWGGYLATPTGVEITHTRK